MAGSGFTSPKSAALLTGCPQRAIRYQTASKYQLHAKVSLFLSLPSNTHKSTESSRAAELLLCCWRPATHQHPLLLIVFCGGSLVEKGQGDVIFATQTGTAPALLGSAVSLCLHLGMPTRDIGVPEVTHSLISQGVESPEGFAQGRREQHGPLSPLLLLCSTHSHRRFPHFYLEQTPFGQSKRKGAFSF